MERMNEWRKLEETGRMVWMSSGEKRRGEERKSRLGYCRTMNIKRGSA